MKTLTTCLIAVALVVPFSAAYADDASYCAAMSKLYRDYRANNSIDSTVTTAMAKCAAGNTAEGIPVLEKALTNAKITLPKR